MAANAIGADQHQRMYGIARGLLHVGGGNLDAVALRLGLDLVAERLLDFAPVAVERGDKIASRRLRPVRLFPGGAVRGFFDVVRRIFIDAKNTCHSAPTAFGST